MALPTLQRKLFQNDGYGPLLKDEIVSKHISVQDWSNAYDYSVATVVRGSDGVLYYSKLQSGPGTGAGAVDPTMDDGTYWTAPKVPTMPLTDNSKALANTEWVDLWYNSHILADTYYVDANNGNDANDGLTAGTAKKTYTALFDFFSSPTNIIPSTVTVNFADGTYDERIVCVSNMHIILHGNSQNTIFTNESGIGCIDANQQLDLSGTFTISSRCWIRVQAGRMRLLNGLSVYFKNNNSGSGHAIRVTANGTVTKADGVSVSFNFSNCTYINSTIGTNTGGSITFGTGTKSFSGSVTGKRYLCISCSGVYNAGSTTLFPGSVAGTVDSTSYYS